MRDNTRQNGRLELGGNRPYDLHIGSLLQLLLDRLDRFMAEKRTAQTWR